MTEFEEIYRLYFSQVERYLLSLCKDTHLAEELTAQTFFSAMRSLKRYRGDSDIRTWLCAIARNSYLTHMRKNGRLVSMEDIPLPDLTQDPEKRVIDRAQAAAAVAAMDALTEPYRQVFILRALEQFSFGSIARLFGKTPNWACVTYYRARKKIMDEMEEWK